MKKILFLFFIFIINEILKKNLKQELNNFIKKKQNRKLNNYCVDLDNKLFSNLNKNIFFKSNSDNDGTITFPLVNYLNSFELDCNCFFSKIKNEDNNIGFSFGFLKNNFKQKSKKTRKMKDLKLFKTNIINDLNKKKKFKIQENNLF